MEYKNSFEVQFAELNSQQKVEFAKGFIKGIEDGHSKIKNTISRFFNQVTNNKSISISEHIKKEKNLAHFQKMDTRVTKSKAVNLRDFNYIDLNELTVLTPKMEEGIKQFVDDFITDKFMISHDIADFHRSFSDAIFRSHDKITNSYTPFKKYLDKMHDTEQDKLKDKYSNLFPNRKKRI